MRVAASRWRWLHASAARRWQACPGGVLADVARLKDVQKLREVEALRVESLRARLAAAELEEKTAAERLRELQDRDAAQLIQDL